MKFILCDMKFILLFKLFLQVQDMLMEQKENFKFGGPRLYPSTRALVAWLAIQGRWFLVKIAVVSTQVPLLLSRPVLSQLGMHFKMDENKADFCGLGLKDVKLGYTPSGHPSVEALSFHGQPPVWPDRLDWSVIEAHIPRHTWRVQHHLGQSNFFIPKFMVMLRNFSRERCWSMNHF